MSDIISRAEQEIKNFKIDSEASSICRSHMSYMIEILSELLALVKETRAELKNISQELN